MFHTLFPALENTVLGWRAGGTLRPAARLLQSTQGRRWTGQPWQNPWCGAGSHDEVAAVTWALRPGPSPWMMGRVIYKLEFNIRAVEVGGVVICAECEDHWGQDTPLGVSPVLTGQGEVKSPSLTCCLLSVRKQLIHWQVYGHILRWDRSSRVIVLNGDFKSENKNHENSLGHPDVSGCSTDPRLTRTDHQSIGPSEISTIFSKDVMTTDIRSTIL